MIYTSRQLLDPSYISNYRNAEQQNYWNRINSLGEAGEQISNIIKERSKRQKEQLDLADRQKLIEEMSTTEDFYNPQFRAALYSFQKTGDRSGIDNYYQTKALNQARDVEAQKSKEEQNRLNEAKYNLAVQDIDTYKTDPERKINAIKNAISVGDAAGKDTTELKELLKKEQNDLEDSILETRASDIEAEKQKIEAEDYAKEVEEVKAKLKDRIKKLPQNAAAKNAEIEEISKIASMYGLTGLDIPEFAKIKTTLTPKEQDEYNDLLDKKNDGRLVKAEEIRRFNWLSQFVK